MFLSFPDDATGNLLKGKFSKTNETYKKFCNHL